MGGACTVILHMRHPELTRMERTKVVVTTAHMMQGKTAILQECFDILECPVALAVRHEFMR